MTDAELAERLALAELLDLVEPWPVHADRLGYTALHVP